MLYNFLKTFYFLKFKIPDQRVEFRQSMFVPLQIVKEQVFLLDINQDIVTKNNKTTLIIPNLLIYKI